MLKHKSSAFTSLKHITDIAISYHLLSELLDRKQRANSPDSSSTSPNFLPGPTSVVARFIVLEPHAKEVTYPHALLVVDDILFGRGSERRKVSDRRARRTNEEDTPHRTTASS